MAAKEFQRDYVDDSMEWFRLCRMVEGDEQHGVEEVLRNLQSPLQVVYTMSLTEVRENVDAWRPAIKKEVDALISCGALVRMEPAEEDRLRRENRLVVLPSKGVSRRTFLRIPIEPASQAKVSVEDEAIKSDDQAESTKGVLVIKSADQAESTEGVHIKSADQAESTEGVHIKSAEQAEPTEGVHIKSADQAESTEGVHIKSADHAESTEGVHIKSADQAESTEGVHIKSAWSPSPPRVCTQSPQTRPSPPRARRSYRHSRSQQWGGSNARRGQSYAATMRSMSQRISTQEGARQSRCE